MKIDTDDRQTNNRRQIHGIGRPIFHSLGVINVAIGIRMHSLIYPILNTFLAYPQEEKN